MNIRINFRQKLYFRNLARKKELNFAEDMFIVFNNFSICVWSGGTIKLRKRNLPKSV